MTRIAPFAGVPLLLLAAAACGTAEARDGAPPSSAALPAWSAPAPLVSLFGATRGREHRAAALAADGAGRPHALFVDDTDGDGVGDVLLHAWMRDGAWTRPERLDAAPGMTDTPRLVTVPDGAVHVLWYERTRPETPARSADALLHRVWRDGAWGDTRTVHARTGAADIPTPHLDARADAAGRVHVVHTVTAGLTESVWADGKWASARATGRDGATPVLGPGARVLAYVAGWTGPEGGRGRSDVVARARREDGAWDEPVAVHVDPREYSHLPRLAADGQGVLHLVWLETRGGQVTPRRILHATSRDGRRWSPATEITPAETQDQILYSPRLSVDGRGRLLLLFTRFGDGGVGRPTHWQMRLDGARWTPAAQLFAALGDSDSELETAAGAQGRLWALWKSRDGTYYSASVQP
jgi:hypothetical protein